MKRTVGLILVTGLALTLAACKTTTSSSSSGPGGPTVSSLAAGTGTSYALETDGTVRAWGNNNYGQLGNGTTSGSSDVPAKVVTSSGSGTLSKVTAIAAGTTHALALKTNGTVRAWGNNAFGQLGAGATGGGTGAPVKVSGLSHVTAIAAGPGWSLALDSNGHVWAWGANGSGQLGNNCGSSCTDHNTPVQVVGSSGTGALSNIAAIAAGGNHALALKTNGTVYAWGANSAGQLGNGTTSSSPTSVPTQVASLSGVADIAAGGGFSLARTTSGDVWAWGVNNLGQLGVGSTVPLSSVPLAVVNVSGSGTLGSVQAIAAGNSFALALKNDGTVRAWGYNADGELGNACGSSCVNSDAPVTVAGSGGSGRLKSATALAAGTAHALALGSNGTVWAWGINTYGQLGISTSTSNSTSPVKVHF